MNERGKICKYGFLWVNGKMLICKDTGHTFCNDVCKNFGEPAEVPKAPPQYGEKSILDMQRDYTKIKTCGDTVFIKNFTDERLKNVR